MSQIVRRNSSQSLWDAVSNYEDEIDWTVSIPAIDEVAEDSTITEANEGEDDDGDFEDQYDNFFARLSQAKPYSQGIYIDPEDDISCLIAEYEEEPIEPTQPAEHTSSIVTKSEDTLVAPEGSDTYAGLGKRNSSASSCVSSRPPKVARFDLPEVESESRPIDKPYYVCQRSLDKWELPFGVLWEINRLVASGKICESDIKVKHLLEIKRLGNNTQAAPLVEKKLTSKNVTEDLGENTKGYDPFAKERESRFPYHELDLEEEQLRLGQKFGCLGFNDNSDWYGGKIHFRARIKDVASQYRYLNLDLAFAYLRMILFTSKYPDFRVTLERAELGPSFRFSRRFGSLFFVRMKLPKKSKHTQHLIQFLLRPFVICGGVYRAFYEKEKTVFFFRTNEIPDGETISGTKFVPGGLSISEFLDFHNPLEINSKQTAAKWASRFALGLSTSAPGLKLEAKNIHEIEDIISAKGEDMTDGSGFINSSALRLLQSKFNWDEWPTAIQCRLGGAKGMLLQHPTDRSDTPQAWLRPSQSKIKYSNIGDDDCRLIIDVLRSCHSRSNCVLGAETIINMAENGVPGKEFKKLLDAGFDRLYSSLTTWEGEDAMYDLWVTTMRVGGVRAARAARAHAGLARVKGYSERDAQDVEDEDGLLDENDEESSVAWWCDEISQQPSSLEETVMRLLDAGFTPDSCPILLEKLSKIIETSILNHGTKYRIEVPMSCMTFIQPAYLPMPDPFGVLEEGQIFYKSARRDLLTPDGLLTDTVLGPVLLTRHPCKLPTDVQKWVAVDCPQLRDQTGIIFFSTKGSRRAADLLGGGDYDGDKGLLIYDPSLVGRFVNADIKYADPRKDIEAEHFSKATTKLHEILATSKPTEENPLALVRALQDYLLGGLRNVSCVGQYSNMHDFATYTMGYRDPETIRLNHMFCLSLDGAKTGLVVNDETLKNDIRKYNHGVMHWKPKDTKKSAFVSEDSGRKITRPSHLPPFIMDNLVRYSEKEAKRLVAKFKQTKVKYKKHILDEDLVAPWREAEELARLRQERGSDLDVRALDEIRKHVERMYEKHRTQVKKHNKPKGTGGASTFTDLPIEVRQNQLRDMSKEFASYPSSKDVLLSEDVLRRLRASYAYLHDYEKNRHREPGFTRFPWDVSMGELCAIKAAAVGRSKTVAAGFYERFFLKGTRR
ncbi:hypothetical protein VNI00_001335 [Paramarasmius palmivorus]|uniref:RNA-dependent RNA polymerase n=1 Tax=Paramarasmius palmivorus TaxID=297713 RepID=A0AAW0E997_9AGAR